eukprot:4474626-Pyramimonas_sp.AAC.1
MAGSLFYILVFMGTLGEIVPSTAGFGMVLEELGVRGLELDKLLADIHMIVVSKADVCIHDTDRVFIFLSHEEISGRPLGGSSGRYLI